MSGIHDENKIENPEYLVQREKYKSFKKINYLIDLSKALDGMTELSYVDEWHYSPKASNLIATKIYSVISKDID